MYIVGFHNFHMFNYISCHPPFFFWHRVNLSWAAFGSGALIFVNEADSVLVFRATAPTWHILQCRWSSANAFFPRRWNSKQHGRRPRGACSSIQYLIHAHPASGSTCTVLSTF